MVEVGRGQLLENSLCDAPPFRECVSLVPSHAVRDVGHGAPEQIADLVIEGDRVGGVGKMLAEDADAESPTELLLHAAAQRFACQPALDGDLVWLRPRGIQELQVKGAARGASVPDRELSGHRRREAYAI